MLDITAIARVSFMHTSWMVFCYVLSAWCHSLHHCCWQKSILLWSK